MLIPIFITITFLALSPAAVFAAPEDSVAMIVSDKAGSVAAYGTGFVITADGDLLTCYHVIQGATRIRVIVGDNWYTDVIVKAVSTTHDLATLHIANLRRPLAFIPISKAAAPRTIQNSSLDVYGYPATLLTTQHKFKAAVTAGSFIKSSIPRSQDTLLSLFAIKDVDLIPLVMTLYNGLSGAPVLANGVAVGVLSGSLEQGGSVAWAIPLKYVDAMTPVGRRPSQMAWQPLALMSSDWKHLLRESKVGLGLLLAFDRYAVASARFEQLAREASLEWPKHIETMLSGLQRTLDDVVRRRGADYLVEDAEEEIDRAMLRVMAPVASRMATLESEFDRTGNAMAEATGILTSELKAHFKAVPQTSENAALQTRVFSLWTNHWDKLMLKADSLENPEEAFEAAIDQLPEVETVGQVRASFPQYKAAMRKVMQDQSAMVDASFQDMHAIAAIIDAALTAGGARR
jgi:hypothetical protein